MCQMTGMEHLRKKKIKKKKGKIQNLKRKSKIIFCRKKYF